MSKIQKNKTTEQFEKIKNFFETKFSRTFETEISCNNRGFVDEIRLYHEQDNRLGGLHSFFHFNMAYERKSFDLFIRTSESNYFKLKEEIDNVIKEFEDFGFKIKGV